MGIFSWFKIKILINDLKNEDSIIRIKASKALGELGDARAVEPLIRSLRDEENYVRKTAAEALGKIGDARAVEPLIRSLKDESAQDGSAWALGELRDTRAVEPLIQALKEEDRYSPVRKTAAEVLGKIGEAKAVEPLIQAMGDDNLSVRYNSVVALAKIGEPAIELLIHALKDENEAIRMNAAEALGKIGDARAVEPLIRSLRDEENYVRKTAAEALGKIGDARAIEPLIQALKQLLEFRYYSHLRLQPAEALGKIGDKRAAETVISYLLQDEDLHDRPLYNDEDISRLKNLFNLLGSYTDIIIKATMFTVRRIDDWDDSILYEYSPNFEGIEKLYKINTQISNNILHQIAQLRDIRVTISDGGCSGGSSGTLGFEPYRKMAREELERRGNPPYNPSAYLDDKAWKL